MLWKIPVLPSPLVPTGIAGSKPCWFPRTPAQRIERRFRRSQGHHPTHLINPLSIWELLSPRMKRLVHALEPILIHVRINLCRLDIRMPQQFLHNPQVRPSPDQVRGKTMP